MNRVSFTPSSLFYSRFRSSSTRTGFTIVELLIVIVVIAILAAVSIVAYTGIQGRARDAQRIQDMSTIAKALEVYKIANGNYPAAVGTTGYGGWESSIASGGFINALVSSSTGISKVPIDPKNIQPGSTVIGANSVNFTYFYYRYGAGSGGCDSARGDFYVLGVTRFDAIPQGQAHPNTQGLVCSTRTWGTTSEGAYVISRFVN